jgi:hypothetical protein
MLKIKRKFKFKIPSQGASIKLSFLIPTLSPYINKKKIENFCLQFNNLTKNIKKGIEVPVIVYLTVDNETICELKSISTGFLLKKLNLINILSVSNLKSKVDILIIYQIVWYKIRFYEKLHNYKKYSLSYLEKSLFSSIYYGLKSSGTIIKLK